MDDNNRKKNDRNKKDDEKSDLIEGIGKAVGWLAGAAGIAGAAIGVFGLIDIFRKD